MALSASMSPGSSVTSPAPQFSSRCATDEVPGMSRTFSERPSSHARPTCEGVMPRSSAIALTVSFSATFGMPGKAEPSGKNGT